MKISGSVISVWTVLLLMTLGYGWLAWLGLGISQMFLTLELSNDLPWVTKIAASSSLTWQILAGASLVLTFIWGIIRSSQKNSISGHYLPMLCHMSWIGVCFFWNCVGAIRPFVTTAYILVNY